MKKSHRIALWLFVLIFGTLIVYFAIRHLLADPKVVLLYPQDGAQWIRGEQPFQLLEKSNTTTFTAFETYFELPAKATDTSLKVMALRRVVVIVDKTTLFDAGSKIVNWKTPYSVPLPATLSPGRHRLRLLVANHNGPSLVRAFCAALNLRTDASWRASPDLKQWSAATMADQPWEPALSREFESTASDLQTWWPLIAVLFAGGVLLSIFVFDRQTEEVYRKKMGSWIRWSIILSLFFLGLRNVSRLPEYVGYDAPWHFEYIQYVATQYRIPLPNAGSTFFQTPVYYVLSAFAYHLLLLLGFDVSSLPSLLRIVPFLCGIGMVEICFRAAGYVFPRRSDLQAVAAAVGGLIPMNLYMAQGLSNEPMAALIAGLLILQTLRFYTRPTSKPLLAVTLIGVMMGLAILTKISMFLWIVPVLMLLGIALYKRGFSALPIAGHLAMVPLVGICICGGYFLRNRIETGQAFYPNSQAQGANWWQDPGFRTTSQFLEFGHVFSAPAYSGFRSFWDSFYSTFWANGTLSGVIDYTHRPPWNYGLMSCGLWLAWAPIMLMFVGAVRALIRFKKTEQPDRLFLQFCILGIAVFVPALIYVFLTLPIYTCVKASYMLSALPCFGILAAAGFDQLNKQRTLRAVCVGFIFTWSAISYLTFFIW